MKQITIAALILLFTSNLHSNESVNRCQQEAIYHLLDFWIGNWDVQTSDGQKVGTNKIEKILNGCAVLENWIDEEGHEGKSFFYYDNVTRKWKQVWVEDSGGMKEKAFLEKYPNGAVRFQGTVEGRNGSMLLDRTTLTPEDENQVRQVIEISKDSGRTWMTVFDANYIRK